MRLCCLLLAWLGAILPLAAAEPAERDLPTRVELYRIDYRLADDAAATTTIEWAVKVLKESALADSKSATVGYSTSVETVEILKAQTRKADGRIVESPKSNFQVEVNGGRDGNAPAFSDRSSITIVFPDLAVGDTAVLAYRLRQTVPIFPGHFSVIDSFPRGTPYDEVRVSLDAPLRLGVRRDIRGLREESSREADGRQFLEWSYRDPKPERSKRRDYSVYDIEADPGYSFSTFKSYADISAAYGQRARPKAAVTPRIRKLAQELTAGRKAPAEQARALYDWVALNITYAGNCIGVGAVVPRDLDFVLDNRMGDCKDHATLLEALLKVRGIASTQALINAGNGYRLPKLPVVSTVNHVINYLPSLRLYLDSTSSTTPFGMLPMQSQDKPALLVEGFRDDARTPAMQPGQNQQRVQTRLSIAEDGSAKGTVEVDLQGLYATELRAGFRQLPREQEEELVAQFLRGLGLEGQGSFEKGEVAGLESSLRYRATLEINGFIQRPGAGAMNVYIPFLSSAPIARFVAAANLPSEDQDVACGNGRSEENFLIELPESMQILALPDNTELKSELASYSASYERDGRQLRIKRVFDDRTPGNVCPPAMMAGYQDFLRKVLPNLRSQVVYR